MGLSLRHARRLGAGALYAASFGGWRFAYGLMAALMLVGMATVWLTPEPGGVSACRNAARRDRRRRGSRPGCGAPCWRRFSDMLTRDGAMLAILALCRSSTNSAMRSPATMSNPLYVSLGFTKVELANIGKVYGFAASLAGLALGGVVVLRLGVMRALLVCGILQMLSNLMYALQVWAGHNRLALALTIGVENLTGGMGSAAFVAYLSGLCTIAFTATQYALLSSLGGGRPHDPVGLGRRSRRHARLEPVLSPQHRRLSAGSGAVAVAHAPRGSPPTGMKS